MFFVRSTFETTTGSNRGIWLSIHDPVKNLSGNAIAGKTMGLIRKKNFLLPSRRITRYIPDPAPPSGKVPPMTLSKGCILCHQGAKMVLFVTGRCHRTCWYCPLSSERKGTDTVYANEHPVDIPAQIIEVAESMSALGTGVTGGEPLLVLEKVTEYCRLLKDHFGPEHQIHLYTAKAPTDAELAEMQGLVDEIRLHPPRECWDTILDSEFIRSAKRAKEMGFDIGIEVPALPGLELLIPALPYLDFLNINELEWGENNAYQMRERGYELADSLHNAIDGAKGWAEELVQARQGALVLLGIQGLSPVAGTAEADRGEHRPAVR